jgi:small-conductance mechanosensitive channel
MKILESLSILEAYTFFGNTGWDYALAIVVFVGMLFVLKIFQLIILARLKRLAKKTKSSIDDVLLDVIDQIKSWFYLLVSLYVSSSILELPGLLENGIELLFYLALIAEAIAIVQAIATYAMRRYLKGRNHDDVNQKAMVNMALVFVRITLWALGFLFILSNLGVNVTSLIASLGIGGIAIAFALQNLLNDIFSSFTILFDKPFSIGDFIVVGKDSGVVEKIGLKTTHIKTLRGEVMIIPNRDLTNSRVQNLKTLERRREVLNFEVEYEIDKKTLLSIPTIVEEVISPVKQVTFDRCHFSSYGESGLQFEAIYYYEGSDYVAFMDAKQKINYDLFEIFEKQKISFAYPTQTVHIKK